MDEEKKFEEMNLKEKLDFIIKNQNELMEKKKVKTWNMPFKAMSLSQKKKRDGWVVFLNIADNKWGTFIKAPIEDGVAIVNGVPHKIDPSDLIMLKKNLSLVIQPQWSIRPFSPNQNKVETEKVGNSTMGWEYIMNYIYKTQIKLKKQISVGIMVLIGLLVVGGGYYLIQSGAFK